MTDDQQDDKIEEFAPGVEQALDVLLSEAHGATSPPDLSDRILDKLHALDGAPYGESLSDIILDGGDLHGGAALSKKKRRIAIASAILVAIAAALLVMFTGDGDVDLDGDPSTQVAGAGDSESDSDDTYADSTPPTDGDVTSESAEEQQDRSLAPAGRGIPLVLNHGEDTESETQPGSLDWLIPTVPKSEVAITLVSTDVDSDMTNYWQAIGIDPSGDAPAEEVAARLAAVVGIELDAAAVKDSTLIQEEIARPVISKVIARRWLTELTGGGINRVEKTTRQALINELSQCFRSKQSFDRTLASWMSGKSEHSSAFYTAFAGDGRHQSVRRLASLTANVDLRCVQCHDSYIEGNVAQSDYWSFAAFLNKGLSRQRDDWSVDAENHTAAPLFYSLPDGRQKIAESEIPQRWVSGPKPEKIVDWSASVVGSKRLARGVVNSLWKLVHGQSLRGHVFDTSSAPHDKALDRLEQRLANDFVGSNFDVGRLLALIVASPSARRSVPEALRPENTIASSEEVHQAMQSVNAFAASMPPHRSLPIQRRIEIAQSRIGATLDGTQPVLAQGTGELSSEPPRVNPNRSKAGSDFPSRAHGLPVQWLSRIEDPQNQAAHLGYLAGMHEFSPELQAAAKQLEEAGEDRSLALQRIWWLVRP